MGRRCGPKSPSISQHVGGSEHGGFRKVAIVICGRPVFLKDLAIRKLVASLGLLLQYLESVCF